MADLGISATDHIALEGARKKRRNVTDTRIRIVIFSLFLVFAAMFFRLAQLGSEDVQVSVRGQARDAITASRPTILDRNGIAMALDIRVPSLYAEPNRMVDKEQAIARLRTVLPELSEDYLRERFGRDKGFIWLARELTPSQQERVFQLGIPGLDFLVESKRFYPGMESASHLLGMVNIDNRGTAGIESRIDDDGLALLQDLGLARDREIAPVSLSIDMRVQHAMREQLLDALTRYKAIAASGVMVDVHTGEVVAMVSLPDFDPNEASTFSDDWMGKKNQRFNRITYGTYELGSTFKSVTFAAALDGGLVSLTDSFDARFGVRFGRFTIDDFHGKHRILQVPEIFKYSSNIGTIKIMQAMGKENYRAFLTKAGFDQQLPIELPETKLPIVPEKFSDVAAATASFGHGLQVTPLHMATAVAAFVNGGTHYPATMFVRSQAEADALGQQLVSPETSDKMRYLLRLNALEGSGRRARKYSDGYRIGGKTGTAEKVVDGQYSSLHSLAVFASAFPMDDPQYAMVILVDEPKNENPQRGRTAGWNAGEVSGRIVSRVSPLLGIRPNFDERIDRDIVPSILR